MGKSNFETAIEKCEKAIKLHSIKARPKSNVNKRKTAKEKAYMARKEFNPFLRHAWLLMGKPSSNRAISSKRPPRSNYISGLYTGQPEIVSVARAYLARCYVELEWPYDAGMSFIKIQRDSIGSEGKREFNASYADYLIFVKQYKEAIPYLQKSRQEGKKQTATCTPELPAGTVVPRNRETKQKPTRPCGVSYVPILHTIVFQRPYPANRGYGQRKPQ